MANKFTLKTFFLDLAEIAPSLITGVLNLKNETGSVSKTQLATDSLNLASGVAEALTSPDPVVQADAAAASAATGSVIQAIAAANVPVTPALVTSAIVQTALAIPPPA